MPEETMRQQEWIDYRPDILGLRISNTTTESTRRYVFWNPVGSEVFKEIDAVDDSKVLTGVPPRPRVFFSDDLWEMKAEPELIDESLLEESTWRSLIHFPSTPGEIWYRRLLNVLNRAIPDDACNFADAFDLWHYLVLAYLKVSEFFPEPRYQKTILVVDPESDEMWLSVRFITEGSIKAIAAAWRRYRQDWVRHVPVGKRHMIRLMYDIE